MIVEVSARPADIKRLVASLQSSDLIVDERDRTSSRGAVPGDEIVTVILAIAGAVTVDLAKDMVKGAASRANAKVRRWHQDKEIKVPSDRGSRSQVGEQE